MTSTVPLNIDVLYQFEAWNSLDTDLEKLIEDSLYRAYEHLKSDQIAQYEPFSVAVVLSSDHEIQALNTEYRGKNKPTNVLSFPAFDFHSIHEQDVIKGIESELGDICLSWETLNKEANEQDKTFESHLKHLLVHGFMHLFGYDHIEDEQAEEMEKIETFILKELGVENPYN